jgi:hypothetical protein
MIWLVWTPITSVSTQVLKHTMYHSKSYNKRFIMQQFSHQLPDWLSSYNESKKVHQRLLIKAKRDTACLNPNNFRFNTSIEAYNIAFKEEITIFLMQSFPHQLPDLLLRHNDLKKVHWGLPHQSTVFRITIMFRGNRIKNPELHWQQVDMKTFWNLFCFVLTGAGSLRYVALKYSSLYSIPEVIPQDETKPQKR